MSSSQPEGLPPGWIRQALQVPTHLGLGFRQASTGQGFGGIKLNGTAAIALLLGLPPKAREALLRYIAVETMVAPGNVDPDQAWKVIVASLEANAADGDNDDGAVPEWYIDKIVDPELTPPPGKKASDRKKPPERGENSA